MDPCTQAENIKAISSYLADMRSELKKQTQILSDVAVQNVRITHLETHVTNAEGSFTEIFNRLRTVESIASKNASAIKVEISEAMSDFSVKLDRAEQFLLHLTGKPAMYVLSTLVLLVIVGTACDLVYHFPMLEKAYKFIKG